MRASAGRRATPPCNPRASRSPSHAPGELIVLSDGTGPSEAAAIVTRAEARGLPVANSEWLRQCLLQTRALAPSRVILEKG